MLALLYALAALCSGKAYAWTHGTFWGDVRPYSESCEEFIRIHGLTDPKVVVRPAVVDSLSAEYPSLDATYSDYQTRQREFPIIHLRSLKIQSAFVKIAIQRKDHLLRMTDYHEMAHRELNFRFKEGDSVWVVFRDEQAERMLRVTESNVPCPYVVDPSGVDPIVRVTRKHDNTLNR